MSDDRLLTAAEVAERLGVPETWVYRAARSGKLPSVKLGHYVRFRWSDVEAWLERETGRAPRRAA